MQILEKRPSLRWIAPVAALAVVGGGLLATNTANADPVLPKLTAQALVAKVGTARVSNFYGTVTETANLGLPSLPVSGGGGGSTDFSSLLSGTNTLQVWTAGADKSRVMLSGSFGESDLVRNGADVWSWNSKAKTASHTTVPTSSDRYNGNVPAGPAGKIPMPTTPQDAAKQALTAIDTSTTVSVDRSQWVAKRAAYELVLTPKSTSTLVGSVRIAVDAKTYLPLRVDVFSKANPKQPSLELAYSEIHYTKPADSVFAFSPPAGTKVTEHQAPTAGRNPGSLRGPKGTTKQQTAKAAQARKAVADNVKTLGTGWSSVLVAKLPADASGAGTSSDRSGRGDTAAQWQQTLNQLPAVQGKGWTGHALNGTLFSVVITSDNRVALGAVGVDQLVHDLG